MSFIAWLQAWQTVYNSRAICRRVTERGSRKTSVCYFSIGALAPDTAEPWSDARTVIWRIPLVSVALDVPPLQEMWHEPARTKIREKQSWLLWRSSTAGNCQRTQTSSLATRDLSKAHAAFWGRDELRQTLIQRLKSSCDAVKTQRHRYWGSSRSVGCQTAMFTNILPPLTA